MLKKDIIMIILRQYYKKANKNKNKKKSLK